MKQLGINCWCGATNAVEYNADYRLCLSCQTLISRQASAAARVTRIQDDERDFYGREYWFSHQAELAHPDIASRARGDLPERCAYWLRTALKYKLPPARVLEIGSGSGAFVALLKWAGFDATGLELSPWVAQFSQETFNIPVLTGPVEDQDIPSASLDLIVAMDVLEHLPDPVGTLKRCLELLKEDGIFLIQTPRYPENRSYKELLSDGDRFVEMLKPAEHVYLFSKSSVALLFDRVGAGQLAFEPAIFLHYDMFLAAGRRPLLTHPVTESEGRLAALDQGRLVVALLDAEARFSKLLEAYLEAEADRAARLEALHAAGKLQAETEAGRIAAVEANDALRQRVAELDVQVASKSETIEVMGRRLAEIEADRFAAWEKNESLEMDLAEREAQLAARTRTIESLEEEAHRLRSGLADSHAVIQALRTSRAYRALRRLNRWQSLAAAIERLDLPSPHISTPSANPARPENHGNRIAVDLTPLLPGGENGGAKLLAVSLVRHLAELTPETQWILLTSDANHAELALLDAPNISRFLACRKPPVEQPRSQKRRAQVKRLLSMALSPRAVDRIRSLSHRLGSYPVQQGGLLQELDADLLFCPFTAPFYAEPDVPIVSLVLDLQHLHYPQFFKANDREGRSKNFEDAVLLADRLICYSDFVKRTILENAAVTPERVVRIYARILRRLGEVPPAETDAYLEEHGLKRGQYLLYPANFWEHKNHRMLLTALGIYRRQNPNSQLKLVCTGTPGAGQQAAKEAAKRMELGKWVVFPGFIPDEPLSVLLQGCSALIFPSLYEGFGLPVLEAMAWGKPVLCSNSTSLPEIAGQAAFFFDPRRPKEIAAAIQKIITDPAAAEELSEAGSRRAASWGSAETMAREYLGVFTEVIGARRGYRPFLRGNFTDGWMGENLTVGFDSGKRELELTLFVPGWIPHRAISVRRVQGRTRRLVTKIPRGERAVVPLALPGEAGTIQLSFEPAFQPRAYRMNQDERRLTCVLERCRLVYGQGSEGILWPHS
jgi:glycosyltransferase involved in cell wall biosynthesis/SAM-dependent methyltransferase